MNIANMNWCELIQMTIQVNASGPRPLEVFQFLISLTYSSLVWLHSASLYILHFGALQLTAWILLCCHWNLSTGASVKLRSSVSQQSNSTSSIWSNSKYLFSFDTYSDVVSPATFLVDGVVFSAGAPPPQHTIPLLPCRDFAQWKCSYR